MKPTFLARCALFSALLCVCAWISIPIGNMTFTLQSFALILALFLLGGRGATVSVAVYLLLGAVGLYDKLVDFAGAGATVPLTGFGNILAKGVKKAVDEKGFWGIFTGGLTAAAGGIAAAVIFGWFAGLIFKQKDK